MKKNRKETEGPLLGLSPGEVGFVPWLKQAVAEAEESLRHEGPVSAEQGRKKLEAIKTQNRQSARERRARS